MEADDCPVVELVKKLMTDSGLLYHMNVDLESNPRAFWFTHSDEYYAIKFRKESG